MYAGTSALQREYARAIASGEMHDLVRAARESDSAVSHGSVQNRVMQLRKTCNHPFLVLETAGRDGEWAAGHDLVRASGKLGLLDRMLVRLRKDGHKVLLFSQMTRVRASAAAVAAVVATCTVALAGRPRNACDPAPPPLALRLRAPDARRA